MEPLALAKGSPGEPRAQKSRPIGPCRSTLNPWKPTLKFNLKTYCPKCPKRCPKASEMIPNRPNTEPKPLRRRLFAKLADLHKTCTGMIRLHVHTPLESSIFAPFPSKVSVPPLGAHLEAICTQNTKQNTYNFGIMFSPAKAPLSPTLVTLGS